MTGTTTDRQTHVLRCAIYARKSQEPGQEQYFNSLDAQAEICSAYIRSQQHRGWSECGKHYVDSACSGGTLDRPALQELLADVEAGLVDIVVIYKLDRLSRSLLDFVRLMAVLDRNRVSFVCVTQNFDTGDSLGRLIMNILLTFAQFERELAGDRIRDKRRAMASRGIWIGSKPPYGYDYVDKRLVENPAEARIVRRLYKRYLELESIGALWRECAKTGVTSKLHVSREGVVRGGAPIHRASVRSILCNPVYAGEVTHLGTSYPGIHRPLVSKKLWQEVQRVRLNSLSERDRAAPVDLLPPRIFDCFGRRMAMVRKYRQGRCERCYYSYATAWGTAHSVPRMRAKACELERLVVTALACFLSDRKEIRAVLLERQRRDLDAASANSDLATRRMLGIHTEQKAAILAALVSRIELSTDSIKIVVRVRQMVRFLLWDGLTFFEGEKCARTCREPTHLVNVPVVSARLSQRLRLPIEAAASPPGKTARNRNLLILMRQVREAQRLVDTRRRDPVGELAARMHRTPGHFMKLLRLNYLAPDLSTAILDGTQPPGLTARQLIDSDLPTDWSLQRKLFGFPEQPALRTTERY